MIVEAKICGLTRPEDAELAVALGAKRLGVVFASGPRVVTTEQAREIVAASGATPVLGVFGPGSVRAILEVVAAAGLAGVQLHGAHDPGIALPLRAAGLEVWRVVPVASDTPLAPVFAMAAVGVDGVVIEARVPGGSGGKGIPVALEIARASRECVRDTKFVLSGGLTADNVANAIRIVRPDMVDVSSGIESAPGIKDRALLVRFLENVVAAHAPA